MLNRRHGKQSDDGAQVVVTSDENRGGSQGELLRRRRWRADLNPRGAASSCQSVWSVMRSITNGHAHCAIHMEVLNIAEQHRVRVEGSGEGFTAPLSAAVR